jgi:transposase
MSRKTKCSLEQKLSAVKSYLEGKSSLRQAAQEFGVDVKTIRQWIAKYRSMGEDGLAALSKNTRYSDALKIAAVYMAVCELATANGYPVSVLCEIAGIARPAYYKWEKPL